MGSIHALDAMSPGAAARLTPVIAAWAREVHEADPLMLGELERLQHRVEADPSPTLVYFLFETLELSIRRAGGQSSSRDALDGLLNELAEADPALRHQLADVLAPLFIHTADLLASLSECSP